MKKITFLLATTLLISTAQLAAQTSGDLYDPSVIHTVKINFEQANWANLLDSLRVNSDDMLIGRVTIDGATYDNCGVSYAKSPTHQVVGKRNPWTIRLNFIDKKQQHQGYRTLQISQALRDPSLVREVLSSEIARRYMPAPRANFTTLTVNQEAKGVYVNIEGVDDVFFQKNFSLPQSPKGELAANTEGSAASFAAFRCVPDVRATPYSDCPPNLFGSLRYEKNAKCYLRNFDILSKEGWDDLIELTRVLNNDPANLNKILNVDRALWFLAFQNVVVNLNSYEGQFSGNYFLVRDATGLFSFMPTEMNLAFGSYKNTNGASDLDLDGLVTLDPMLHADNAMKPLITQLIKNQDLRKIYFAHIRQILADWFDNDHYKTRAEELQKLIMSTYAAATEKPYDVVDFQRSLLETVGKTTKIPGIVELMSKRTKWLKKYPDLLNVPPQVSNISFSSRQKFTAKSVGEFHLKAKVDNFPRRVRVFYRPTGANTEGFREAQMLDDGNNHDGEAGDKIFGATIQPNGKFDAIEYYIVAENAGGASFEPSNYINERRKISLAEINK